MTTSSEDESNAQAREAVVGLEITGVSFLHDFVEIHVEDVVLTGLTKPFGLIRCGGVGPASMVSMIGQVVDDLVVAETYVALDSGESRIAFPIGGPTARGPESVLLVVPAVPELGIEKATWVW